MGDVLHEITTADYSDYNCFFLGIISHGTKSGWLVSAPEKASGNEESTAKKDEKPKGKKAWDIEKLMGHLDRIKDLKRKPKIVLIQACRGNGTILLI